MVGVVPLWWRTLANGEKAMIIRFTSEQLRKMAAQLDALTMMEANGAEHVADNTIISVDGVALAYAHWWDAERCYMAEVIDFTPGQASPLSYHTVSR